MWDSDSSFGTPPWVHIRFRDFPDTQFSQYLVLPLPSSPSAAKEWLLTLDGEYGRLGAPGTHEVGGHTYVAALIRL